MLAGSASRRGMQAEEGRASVNNESIDPPADDGWGCYGDGGSVTQSVEEMSASQRRAVKVMRRSEAF